MRKYIKLRIRNHNPVRAVVGVRHTPPLRLALFVLPPVGNIQKLIHILVFLIDVRHQRRCNTEDRRPG